MLEPIKGHFQPNAAASTDVKFFNMFSGEKKDRILLGGVNDKTNRLAIACFKDNEYPKGEGTKWVELTLPGQIKPVKADIRSIEVRLGISRDKILDFSREGTLEQEINARAEAYQNDLKIVQDFRNAARTFLGSEGDGHALDTFIKAFREFKPNEIKNKEIKQVYEKFKSEFNKNISHVEATNVRIKELQIELTETGVKKPSAKRIKEINTEILQLNAVVKKIDYNKSHKINFEKSLKRFDKELFGIDRNFSFKSAENNVIRTLWWNVDLVLSRAQSMGSESSGKLATRLQLVPGDNRYSILTDGKIYHEKPHASADYVPYSRDGKTWVLLSIQSLSSRFVLKPIDIVRAAAQGWEKLDELMKKPVEAENMREAAKVIINLVNIFMSEDVKDSVGLLFTYNDFIEELNKNSPYYKETVEVSSAIKDIFITSDTKAQAMARCEYHHRSEPESKEITKITKDNITDFANEGLFIDNKTSSNNIPVKIKLGRDKYKVEVETTGFVHTQEPKSTDEYYALQFKKGSWILLNVESLKSDIQIEDIKKIKTFLNDLQKLNDFIDLSKKEIPKRKDLMWRE